MARLIVTAALAFGCAMSASAQDAPAPIATLTEIERPVLVNQGDEFRSAVDEMRLKPGDRIMVQDNGEAEIVFDDECKLEIEENRIVTIPDRSTCAGGVPVVQQLNPAGNTAIGATGATGTGNGGVWAMVAIVAAIDLWWLNEDDHDTASP